MNKSKIKVTDIILVCERAREKALSKAVLWITISLVLAQ